MTSGVVTAIVDASAEDQLGPFQRPSQSRYLTSIANWPLISHVVDGLARSGIERIVIASGSRLRQQLAPVVLGAAPSGADITFFDTDSAPHRWGLIAGLREMVAGGAVLFQPGDCLFTCEIPRLLKCFRAERLDLVVLDRSAQGSVVTGTAPIGRSGSIRLPRDDPEATALVLGPSAWPVLEQISEERLSPRRLIDVLVAAGRRVRACDAGEHWCYSESRDGLLTANRIVLDAMPFAGAPAKLSEDTEAHGRVVVSPSARVSRSALRGPVVIGPKAVVADSFIGPYTTIGSGATVVGAEIDYTMVLADAEIRYPGQRLQSSVIGEGALVSRVFELPTGLRLQLQPGSSVILN